VLFLTRAAAEASLQMRETMAVLFWASLILILYAYAGYPLLLRLLAAIRVRPVRKAAITPAVSVVMAVHNEEASLPAKLENLRALEYPRELLEIVVASDGSTDGTARILEAEQRVTAVILPEARGKAVALNAAVAAAHGEILVFFDARQTVDAAAVRELCSCFADPEVGAASGELLLEDTDGRPAGDALGLYWRIEKAVRRLESATGSVVGVTGAIYAIRRELWVDLPQGTILDDVLVPMNVARTGRRVIFEPAAIARDRIFQKPGKEFARKVRTLTGNYQLVQLAPWLLTPADPLLFRLVSHKLLRLMVPLLLVTLLVTSVLAGGRFYHLIFAAQLIFYGLAALGWLSPSARRLRAVAVAETFTMLNLAAGLAFYNFAAGRKKIWG
jgi:poly-beta-1,6-N-acetyl-D-glucosamine synthase